MGESGMLARGLRILLARAPKFCARVGRRWQGFASPLLPAPTMRSAQALHFPADDGRLSMSILSSPPLDASALSGSSVRSGARNSHLFGSADSSCLDDKRSLASIPLAACLQPPAGLWHPIAMSPVAAAALEPLPPSPRAQRAGPQRVLTPYGRQLLKAGLLPGSAGAAAQDCSMGEALRACPSVGSGRAHCRGRGAGAASLPSPRPSRPPPLSLHSPPPTHNSAAAPALEQPESLPAPLPAPFGALQRSVHQPSQALRHSAAVGAAPAPVPRGIQVAEEWSEWDAPAGQEQAAAAAAAALEGQENAGAAALPLPAEDADCSASTSASSNCTRSVCPPFTPAFGLIPLPLPAALAAAASAAPGATPQHAAPTLASLAHLRRTPSGAVAQAAGERLPLPHHQPQYRVASVFGRAVVNRVLVAPRAGAAASPTSSSSSSSGGGRGGLGSPAPPPLPLPAPTSTPLSARKAPRASAASAASASAPFRSPLAASLDAEAGAARRSAGATAERMPPTPPLRSSGGGALPCAVGGCSPPPPLPRPLAVTLRTLKRAQQQQWQWQQQQQQQRRPPTPRPSSAPPQSLFCTALLQHPPPPPLQPPMQPAQKR